MFHCCFIITSFVAPAGFIMRQEHPGRRVSHVSVVCSFFSDEEGPQFLTPVVSSVSIGACSTASSLGTRKERFVWISASQAAVLVVFREQVRQY